MEVHLKKVKRYDGGYKLIYGTDCVWEEPFVFDAPKGEYPDLDEYLDSIVEIHGLYMLEELAKAGDVVSKLNVDYFFTKTGETVWCILSPESTPEKPIYAPGWNPAQRLAIVEGRC